MCHVLIIFAQPYIIHILFFMKDKLIARLRALFPGVNLSKSRIDGICNPDKLKITEETEETEIDQKLKDLNDIMDFAAVAKNDDRLRTLEAKEKKNPPADPKDPAEPKNQDPSPSDPPANPAKPEDLAKIVADAVAAAVTPLTTEINNMKAGKAKESRLQVLEGKLKDANPIVKELLLDRFNDKTFDTDEAFEAFLTEVDTKVSETHQKLADQGLQNSGRPIQPNSGTGDKLASEKELDAAMSNL